MKSKLQNYDSLTIGHEVFIIFTRMWISRTHIWLTFLFLIITSFACECTLCQCSNQTDQNLSPKIANYIISVDLDRSTHTAYCKQEVTWTNTSPNPVSELRLYMYMNAFKNRNSSYLEGRSNFFGADIESRKKEEFGFIEITKMTSPQGENFTDKLKYIQPNDGNKNDESVISLELPNSIGSGESIKLMMDFTVKLPLTLVRSGYGKNDFHLFVHWFPQMGVLEQNKQGEWGWNCHQFLRNTEFYADFGNYDVTITADKDFVIGASGCRVAEKIDGDKKTSHFIAHDLIDFGWTAYPLFETYTETWEGVDIELLIPGEHCGHASRYLKTIKQALSYLSEHVGPYYYPKITIIDPPLHSLRSGFMEYPMMITCASVYGVPNQFRGIESLLIHEFTHMYFMGTLASNEKEEAWLDEGFVTFFEGEIMDYYHGDKSSFYDFGGFRTGKAQNSRQMYTTLKNPGRGIIAKPGWEIEGAFKELIYGKTSTALRSFKNIIGQAKFDEVIKHYYDNYKFTHPKEADWLGVLDSLLSGSNVETEIDHQKYFQQVLHTNKVIDFEVVSVDSNLPTSQKVTVRNNGDFELAAEVQVTLEDDEVIMLAPFNGVGEFTYELKNKKLIKSVYIDPDHKIQLDINFINNSYTTKPNERSSAAYGGYAASFGEVFFHLISFLL